MRLSAGSKGKGPVTANFASGGEVLTSRSKFLKGPNQFTTDKGVEQDYGGKKDPLAKPQGETKVEKTVKPRS
jgi:hypothetical protein